MNLEQRSELFHAFEWLRMQALNGNQNAAIALLEWNRIAEELSELKKKLHNQQKKPLTPDQGA